MPELSLQGVECVPAPSAQGLWSPLQGRFPSAGSVAVVGPNGCGKSCLLRLLAGRLPWQRGELLCGGEPLQGRPPERRPLVLLSASTPLLPHLDVLSNVSYPSRQAGSPDHAWELLHLLGVEALATRAVSTLSAGQAQRVVWARGLNRPCAWLLADEAMEHLDGEGRAELWKLLRRWLPQRRTGLLLVTHRLTLDLPWLDEVHRLGPSGLHKVALDQPPGDLWWARQLAPECVWWGGDLEPFLESGWGEGWWWIPADAWLSHSSGLPVSWLRAARDGWTAEWAGRRWWVEGAAGSGPLLPDRSRSRLLDSG